MREKEYRRLTRSTPQPGFTAIASRSSLWLGKDHLLCIDASYFTETYRRFYFHDIQAIILVKTKRQLIWNIVLFVPLFVCLVILANLAFDLRRENLPAIIAWATCAVVFGTIMLINTALGATCSGYLRTAVQIERVPSLRRIRSSRRILNRIRPLILAVQGNALSGDEVTARMHDIIRAGTAAQAASPAARATPVPGVSPGLSGAAS